LREQSGSGGVVLSAAVAAVVLWETLSGCCTECGVVWSSAELPVGVVVAALAGPLCSRCGVAVAERG